MSLFPFISVSDDLLAEATTDELPLYKEVAWDYKTNSPILKNGTFVIVEGVEAINIWCYKALLTPRFYYPIYTSEYGSEIMDLIGKAYTPSLTKSEAKRYIEEALDINPYITSVEVAEMDFEGNKLTATININTIYGESEVRI